MEHKEVKNSFKGPVLWNLTAKTEIHIAILNNNLKDSHLRDHYKSKGQSKENHVYSIHPAQEYEIRCYWWAKVTYENMRSKKRCQIDQSFYVILPQDEDTKSFFKINKIRGGFFFCFIL